MTAMQMTGLRLDTGWGPAVIDRGRVVGRSGEDRAANRRRFLIVDPQAMVRHGLALSLQSRHPGGSAYQAATVDEALILADGAGKVDLIVLDIDLYPATAHVAVRRLNDAFSAPVIVTSSTADPAAALACLSAGARAFLLKTDPGAVLEHTVGLILSGGDHVPLPGWLISKGRMISREEACPVAPLDRLTARQREIFSLILSGCSNKEIARKIGVLEGTVKVHVRAMMQKLGAANRTQVAVMAARSGLRPDL